MLGKPSHRTRSRLKESGRRAPATVLEVAERGMAITTGSGALVSDTEMALKVKLRVEPAGEPAFEVQERFRFSQFSVPVAGMKLAVIFDPEDHDRIMLDDDPAAAIQTRLASQGLPADQLDLIQQVMGAATSGGDARAVAQHWAEQHNAGAGVPAFLVPGAMGTTASPAGRPADAEADPIELLSRLADLKERGVLTDAEFAQQKARILGE